MIVGSSLGGSSSFFNQEAFLQFGQSGLLHVRPGVCGRATVVAVVFLLGGETATNREKVDSPPIPKEPMHPVLVPVEVDAADSLRKVS